MKTIEELTAGDTAWYSSNDEEIWEGGPYATREEAEAEAESNEHRLITQATKTPVRLSNFFDQGSFFEAADECLYSLHSDDDPVLDFTAEINLDLQARVRAAIDEWQVAHQLSPTPWRFESCDEPKRAAWVTGEALHATGRYFIDRSFGDLTRCNHGDTGEFDNDANGQAIAILWNAWRAGEIGKHHATLSVSPELALATDILEELARARAKFPGKNVTFAALIEEVGELATATFEEGSDRVRKEAVQVAVMAMRMILDGDRTYEPWRAKRGLDPLDPALRIEPLPRDWRDECVRGKADE